MAVSNRNRLGVGGARLLDPLEAQFPPSSNGAENIQPFGVIDGRYHLVDSSALLQRTGTQWIHTMVDNGSDAAQVVAVQDPTSALGPVLKITTNDAQHDSNQIQYAIAKTLGSTTLSAYAPFVAKSGYNISFGCRFMTSTTVANQALLIGLSVVDTTLLSSSAIATTDFIGFYKAASATMGGVVRTSSTSTTTALTVGGTSGWTPTVSTWYDIEFRLVGRTSITFYVNGEKTGSTTMTNLPADTVVLCPSIAVGAATAAVTTAQFRGFYCGQEVI